MVAHNVAALVRRARRQPSALAPVDIYEAGGVEQVEAEFLESRARKQIEAGVNHD